MSQDWKSSINSYIFPYDLPSGDLSVKFHPIGIKELKNLLMIENEEDSNLIEEALDMIISSVVVEPEDFNVDNITLQDRFSLMHQIRLNSKGSLYTIEMTCPKCGSQFIYNIKLDELEVISKPENVNHAIKINDEVVYYIDYVTRGEQKEVENFVEEGGYKNIKEKTINKLFYSLAAGIKKIYFEGKEVENITLADKVYAIEKCSPKKLEEITDWYNKNNYGVNFETEIKCPHIIKKNKKQELCGWKSPYKIPLESFFV